MFLPVVCFSCGYPCNQYLFIYEYLLEKNIQKKKKILPSPFDETVIIDPPDFDKVSPFLKDCCKTMFLTHISFKNYA